MNINKFIFFICIAIALFLGCKAIITDPPGYCRAQQRYISDDEYLKTAKALFEWDLNRDRKYPNGTLIKKKDHVSFYEYWELTRNHSDCCKVDREETESLFNRMFNLQEVLVILYTGEIHGDRQAWFHFDTCGKLIPSDSSFLGSGVGDKTPVTTTNYQELINEN